MTRPRRSIPLPLGTALGAALAAALAVSGLGCHSGSPAAPGGITIFTTCEYVPGARDFTTGNFEARITALLLDTESNVPQTGVGVFFVIDSGPGTFAAVSPIRTNNAGQASNTLIATGATSGNKVKAKVFSGATTVDLDIDVVGCDSTGNAPPRISLSVSPATTPINTDVRVDVTGTTDDGCGAGGTTTPREWSVDWGDGTVKQDIQFASDKEETHRYTTADTYFVRVTVEDCGGLTSTETRPVEITAT